MKVLILALLFVAGALGRSAVRQPQINAEGPKCPIDDPLRNAGPLPINVTLDPLLQLVEGSQITDLIAEGLSSLHYKIDLNVILLTASFEVTLPRAEGNATYTASGYIDARPISQETIPSGNFTGSGLGKVGATGVNLKGSVSIYLTLLGKVQVSRLNLQQVSFDSLALDLGENFVIGGQPIDWAGLSSNIKENFDRDFAQHKNAIQDKIRGVANGILVKYTLQDLIDLIGEGTGDCEAP